MNWKETMIPYAPMSGQAGCAAEPTSINAAHG
jgi:hypothetical protein